MWNPIVLLTLAGPFTLASVALLSRFNFSGRHRFLLAASRASAALSLVLALGIGIYVLAAGPMSAELIGVDPASLILRLDALSMTMLALIAFVGLVVIQFSRKYLDGEQRQGVFLGRICLTLCAVSMLVLSGSLLQLVVAWIGTSVALHRLLLYYDDRSRARSAARKKFICARIGDAFVILAAGLLYMAFGTGDLTHMFKVARELSESGDTPFSAMGAAVSIVLAAAFKSAQFPFHGWLTEVMETPTPVSALLHAGIVNAGGFLVVRFSDVIVLSGAALLALVLIGAITALIGSLVMLTQANVKTALAWSTIAQMGFMLLQCGLGAFSAATLHIVAHSLYKAHAFLSAGSGMAETRSTCEEYVPPSPLNTLAAGVVSALVVLAVGTVMGMAPAEKPAIVALGVVLALGFTPMLARSFSQQHGEFLAGRFLLVVVGLSAAYFALQSGAAALLRDTVAVASIPSGLESVTLVFLVATFGLTTLYALYLPRWATRWPALYVHASNGFYADAIFDRSMGKLTRARFNG